jgi:hypothetical protein
MIPTDKDSGTANKIGRGTAVPVPETEQRDTSNVQKPEAAQQQGSDASNEKKVARYIAHATVYACLQNNLIRLIKLIDPKYILELGFGGNSHTAIKVAKEFPKAQLTVVNDSTEMIEQGKTFANEATLSNIEFISQDVMAYINKGLQGFNLVYLLYNFHHIADKVTCKKREKVDFLNACYENMSVSSFLCVADDFLPEICDESRLLVDKSLEKLYEQRATESKMSTFWGVLQGVELKDVHEATGAADDSFQLEKMSFLRIKEKQGEYLVKKSWLVDAANSEGFAVIIDKDVNSIGDAILLFKKPK